MVLAFEALVAGPPDGSTRADSNLRRKFSMAERRRDGRAAADDFSHRYPVENKSDELAMTVILGNQGILSNERTSLRYNTFGFG